MKKTDAEIVEVSLYFLPVTTRVPLKFGKEISTGFDTALVRMVLRGTDGHTAVGWGESTLSPAWAWPSAQLGFAERLNRMKAFCRKLCRLWNAFRKTGHAMEIGYAFEQEILEENAGDVPRLASLICCAPFDLALHDAYGNLNHCPVYQTCNAEYMNWDLSRFFGMKEFSGFYPADFFVKNVPSSLPVWHLVGGKDALTAEDLTGQEPKDGYPVVLTDWIRRDGLTCLKIKLTGCDAAWDYERCVKVGKIALACGVKHLSTDFNCLVTDPEYVNAVLDRLLAEEPDVYNLLLYVEQPFPFDLENNRINVHSVSARKPLFMDESAHDWKLVRLGFELGWTGVALKTCKTQTGALLSACMAKHLGMTLMVQDLTNPRLAIIPHALLAAHVGTIMGVECNAAQFYPAASDAEAKIHTGLYERRNGKVDFSTLKGSGFGMRVDEIGRTLPEPEIC